MGWRFRKSRNIGPFRINFSKSGVGYSVGGKFFRWTKKANGGTRTTTTIPGTGISYVRDYPAGKESATNTSGQGHSAQPPKRKPPFYRRKWFIILMALLVIGIIGNLVEPPQEQVASNQANEPVQDEKESLDTPKTPAEIDAELCDAVISADVQMDALSDAIASMADGSLTVEGLNSICDSAVDVCFASLDTIEKYLDDEAAEEYAAAAEDAVNNVAAAHIKLQDYLKSSDDSDIEYTLTCLNMRNDANIAFVAARELYLMNSGFSTDEIDALNEALGITSDASSTSENSPATEDDSSDEQVPAEPVQEPGETTQQPQANEPEPEPQEADPQASEPDPAPVVTPEPEPQPDPAPQQNQSNSHTVYITPTGKRYHYDNNCNGGTYIPSTLAEAQAMGLTPCKKCAGG